MNGVKSSLAAVLVLFLSLSVAVQEAAAAAAKDSPAKKSEKQQKIDLNTATEAELMELPGVGEVTAKKIIANRPYSSTKDLAKAGLSENAISKIAPRATAAKASAAKKAESKAPSRTASKKAAAKDRVSAKPAPAKSSAAKAAPKAKTSPPKSEPRVASGKKVDLNTASEEELQELPGVGPAYAKKIIDNRPYRSVSELSKAGLPASAVEKFSGQVVASGPRASTRTTAAEKRAPAARPAPRVEAPTPDPLPTATPPITPPVPAEPEPEPQARAERQERAPAAEQPMPSRAAPARPRAGQPQAGAKVDLNTATQAELEALPGVGPVYAKKIIDNRPYNSTADLSKAELPAGTLEKMSGLVTAGGDQVWLNTESNIFHRSESPWYGKTRSGKFVSEQEALDAGARESER